MPQWAGSSWYFMRYCDPHNHDAIASKEAMEYWSPVDWYNGGMEHTTLHLLYSRFWHKFLYDLGVVPTKEPYQKRTSHGMILGLNPMRLRTSLMPSASACWPITATRRAHARPLLRSTARWPSIPSSRCPSPSATSSTPMTW